jgi:uncharacterized membrane-anchored protein
MQKNFAVFALVLMLLLPSLLLAKAMFERDSGQIWQVPITGYDPRDLLRGHYLNFRYDWDMVETDHTQYCTAGRPCCLCLNERVGNDFTNPEVRAVDCGIVPELRQCTSLIKGMTQVAPQTYFVPEKHALRLEKMLQANKHDFKMEIAVPRSGGPAIIRDLYIDQKPLARFLYQND